MKLELYKSEAKRGSKWNAMPKWVCFEASELLLAYNFPFKRLFCMSKFVSSSESCLAIVHLLS